MTTSTSGQTRPCRCSTCRTPNEEKSVSNTGGMMSIREKATTTRNRVRGLLRRLDVEWYGQRKALLGGLRLERIWGLAVHVRDRRLKGMVTDCELFGLVWETLNVCIDRFDPSCQARTG